MHGMPAQTHLAVIAGRGAVTQRLGEAKTARTGVPVGGSAEAATLAVWAVSACW